ncbi:MAG: hydrolase [Legionellaceae bacterium]|nr:hydrolase [Legionellaceae bacterium]
MIIDSAFRPAWWLANPHMQTMFPTLTRRLRAPIDLTERLELPDGDFIDLAWAVNGLHATAPLVILLHGLGGSAQSTYVAGQMHAYNRNGWRAVLMHFRGASSEPNRLPRAYHSGETGDLHHVLEVLAAREPATKKAVVGVSLGGNVLLKWLGEQGEQSLIQTAAAVSVPFLLNAVADKMNHGFTRCYRSYLLGRMQAMFLRKIQRYPETFSGTLNSTDYKHHVESASCFWTFDDRITAPLHGFSNVHAYYRESSSRRYLSQIKTPTLIIHALDDPFMTPQVVPQADELSEQVTLEVSKRGGHVGFISGSVPGNPTYWLDQRIPEFLRETI